MKPTQESTESGIASGCARGIGSMRAIFTFLVILVSVGLWPSQSQRLRAADAPGTPKLAPSTQPTSVKYRIVRVVIPTDSPLRGDIRLNHPPDLYVVVKKDGKVIGTSGSNEGWEVEYNATKTKNRFEIETSDTVSYTIELWSYNHWSRDNQVLSITGLKAADFANPIIEHWSAIDAKERATRIEFKRVD